MSPAARTLLAQIVKSPLLNDAVNDENRPALKELYEGGLVDMQPEPLPYQWRPTHLGRHQPGETDV